MLEGALAGCWVAASRYRRREYMAIAWYLIGGDYALLFVKDLMFGRVLHLLAPHGIPTGGAPTGGRRPTAESTGHGVRHGDDRDEESETDADMGEDPQQCRLSPSGER